MLLDADADGDVDLFDDEPLEDDVQCEALLAAGDLLLLADAPAGESPAHSPVPDSFESVASPPSHTQYAQHFSHGSDPDRASSVAPAPSFAFDHDVEEDSDPVFPPGFDPDQEIEFIPLDQPMEDPVDPVGPVDPIDPEFDFEMAYDDREPTMAPEPVAALDPTFEHDPVHAGAPIIDPVIVDPPIDDHPVDAPLLEGDHVVPADPVDPPLIADIPAGPLVAPHLDPMPVQFDRALFEAHAGPRDEHAQHGWIDDDDESHLSWYQLLLFLHPSRPGEGSSAHPFGHVPTPIPVVPQFSPAVPPVPPFPVSPFDPASEPFLWSSPPVMPPTDPYHPFHMGYSIEDVLMSFVVQHEALTRRIQELERAQPPPCQCQGLTHPAPSQHPRPLLPDYAARLLALEQQVASWLRTQRAMEEDWLHLRRLFYTHFPPPPPPSV
ncbi:hypothetical protein HanPI659440_Chr02g0045651 [Helianthus annuus]|nr:hypothetical protein HanPI659440_Chr02g0045651 [Helianthus annuus]